MTCKEIHDQITAYVDDRVDEASYRAKVRQHIEHCANCRREYEAELSTKLAVRRHSTRTRSPESLRAAVAHDIASQSPDGPSAQPARPQRGSVSWLDHFAKDWMSPGGVTIALGIVAGAIWLLGDIGHSDDVVLPGQEVAAVGDSAAPALPSPTNFLNQALRNFDAIKGGQLGLAYETAETADLVSYFRKEGVPYDARVPSVRLPLIGGVVSKHGPGQTTSLAHWVYAKGEDLVYFFEVPERDLRAGTIFYLTNDALDNLKKGEHLWQEFGPSSHLCAFEAGDRVYAVVSNLEKDQLRRIVPGL